MDDKMQKLSNDLRKVRENQPRVSLAEAQGQAKRLMAAADKARARVSKMSPKARAILGLCAIEIMGS